MKKSRFFIFIIFLIVSSGCAKKLSETTVAETIPDHPTDTIILECTIDVTEYKAFADSTSEINVSITNYTDSSIQFDPALRNFTIMGQGEGHNYASFLVCKNPETMMKKMSIAPGEKKIVLSSTLKKIFDLKKDLQFRNPDAFAWDWKAHISPPASPIHDYIFSDHFCKSTEIWAIFRAGDIVITSQKKKILIIPD
ncbi:MAG: hypothetical protein KKA07_04340 [Bacteroidetes bacterium]|nr:hypothetical protein [Bacteroidota bacterium]MBU1718281.1 hypothetical protein [Bacteroidota bacterium]